jgi:MOSC domain-containing protein YiiM
LANTPSGVFAVVPPSTIRVLSLNVGGPRQVNTRAGIVLTSIFKVPVEGKVRLVEHNLAGDRQSDLRVHGGPCKAVYLYPFEHYAYWKQELPDADLPYGAFGENLTTEGVTEDALHIGDRVRIGSAVLQVTQPRMPCYKLALRFGRADMVKRFWASGRSGIYFSIVEEGELASGDRIEVVATDPHRVSVRDVVRLFKREVQDDELLERVLKVPLYGSWKRDIQAGLVEEEESGF